MWGGVSVREEFTAYVMLVLCVTTLMTKDLGGSGLTISDAVAVIKGVGKGTS